jgi:hypothetical protein
VLDMVVVRPRFVARKPRGQRLGRLRPVHDRERDQRKSDDDGEPNEQTVALHRPSLVKSSERGAENKFLFPSLRGTRWVKASPPERRRGSARGRGRTIRPAIQNETATRGWPFRSPSRFRFRPPAPLTFGFRLLPSLPASTYLRSVLGADRNLGEDKPFRKRSERRKGRNLQKFNFPHFHSRPCSLWKVPPLVELESCICRTCLARLRSTAA